MSHPTAAADVLFERWSTFCSVHTAHTVLCTASSITPKHVHPLSLSLLCCLHCIPLYFHSFLFSFSSTYTHAVIIIFPHFNWLFCFLRLTLSPSISLSLTWPAGWKEPLVYLSCCLSGASALLLPSNCSQSSACVCVCICVCVCVCGGCYPHLNCLLPTPIHHHPFIIFV